MFDLVLREHSAAVVELPSEAVLELGAVLQRQRLPLSVEFLPNRRVSVGASHQVGFFPFQVMDRIATVTVVPKGTPEGAEAAGVGHFLELVLLSEGAKSSCPADLEGWSPATPGVMWPLILARTYVDAIDALIKRELRKGYRWRSKTLSARVEGSLDISKHLRLRRRGRAHHMPCTWEDFDWDHRLNQVLKAALGVVERRRVLLLSAAGRASHSLLPVTRGRVTRALAPVSDLPVPRARAASHRTPTRLPPAYRRCLALARLVLDSTAGATAGLLPGVAFSAHLVFEKACEALVAEAARQLGVCARRQTFGPLQNVHNTLNRVGGVDKNLMKPDLVLHDRSRALAVGDAKYKELFEEKDSGLPGSTRDAVQQLTRMSSADLYQMFVYLRASNCQRGFFMLPFWSGAAEQSACVVDESLVYTFSPLDGPLVEMRVFGLDLLAPVGCLRADTVAALTGWLRGAVEPIQAEQAGDATASGRKVSHA